MRRILLLAAAAALAIAAVAAPEPDVAETPVRFDNALTDTEVAFSGVWYCPRAEATLEKDTILAVGSAEQATAALTFPNPVPGEEPERARFTLSGADAADVLLSDVALRGDAPGLVEFTTPRSAVFATTLSEDARYGDACIDAVPKVWYLAGWSTQERERLSLRLFNPFPEPAKVTILAVSEIGIEPLPEVASVSVSARSWRDFDLDDTLRFREVLAFTVTPEEGLAFPSILIGNDDDEASWPATRLAEVWEFPVTRVAGATPELVVLNPSDEVATVTVDVYTADGAAEEARTQEIAGTTPVVIALDDLSTGPMGLRVRATRPVAAALVATGGAGLAGTVGAPEPASRWLVPGRDPDDGDAAIWLLNSGPADATVTIQPLIEGGQAVKLLVPGGSLRQVLVETGAPAHLVSTGSPITVAWSGEAANGIVFVAGASLPE